MSQVTRFSNEVLRCQGRNKAFEMQEDLFVVVVVMWDGIDPQKREEKQKQDALLRNWEATPKTS